MDIEPRARGVHDLVHARDVRGSPLSLTQLMQPSVSMRDIARLFVVTRTPRREA